MLYAQTPAAEKRRLLRERLAAGELLRFPGAFNPLSARLIEQKGFEGVYIHAVYYPGENQIQTVMQQGDLFAKQEQLFSVVATGANSLLTVDIDVEPSMPVPPPMVKMLLGNVLDQLAANVKQRAEQLAG